MGLHQIHDTGLGNCSGVGGHPMDQTSLNCLNQARLVVSLDLLGMILRCGSPL